MASARLYLAGLASRGREASAAGEKGERASDTATMDLRINEGCLTLASSSESLLCGVVEELLIVMMIQLTSSVSGNY